MIEAYGDIWDHAEDYDIIVVTTNGFTKNNGEAVMGRGIALEAKSRYPNLPAKLGTLLKKYGNHVFRIEYPNQIIITFPVKPEYGPYGEPGWRARADMELIKRSTSELVDVLTQMLRIGRFDGKMHLGFKVLMPRPGCGNGGLKWEDVKPIIEPLLDDRFTVMERL